MHNTIIIRNSLQIKWINFFIKLHVSIQLISQELKSCNYCLLYVFGLPHKTDGLTGSSHPANQAGEEEAEAEGDDGVAPEHVAIQEPVNSHGGGQHPGHVPDQDAANHLVEEQSVIMFVNS